jgi:thiamine kinase-like enzyme
MERQKNYLQFARNEKTLLPIEEEFLSSIKDRIENKTKSVVSKWEKYESKPIYDTFLMIVNETPLLTKVNLSPDYPNFWKELIENNFDFHPKIVCSSDDSDEFQFICYEVPKGIFFSDLSNYPLARKLNLQRVFLSTIDKMHQIKIASEDSTIKTIESLLPRESMSIYKTYPIVGLFSGIKLLFKKIYVHNFDHLGLCHFDLSHENIIYTGQDIKLINFEYASHANIYLDIWLAKETLNCSDAAFEDFTSLLPKDKVKTLYSYQEAALFFNFAYFNSKIISEYITFGLRDPVKLKFWINKSEGIYNQIFDKLFVDKSIDKLIRDFYYLWH